MSPELERVRQGILWDKTYLTLKRLLGDFERLVREDERAKLSKQDSNLQSDPASESISRAAPAPAAPLSRWEDLDAINQLRAELKFAQGDIAGLSAHIAAQNDVLSALCAKAGIDFTDVEAAKKALEKLSAELEQVKAALNQAREAWSTRAVNYEREVAELQFGPAEQMEAALGEKGQQ